MSLLKKPVNSLLLLAILILTFAVRLWGINFGLPYLYHPDEPRYVESAQILFKTHSLDPASLPDIASSSFVYVINAAAYLPYYWIGKLKGVFLTSADIPAPHLLIMGVGETSSPSTFLLGRLVTLLFGVGSVALLYLICRKLFQNDLVSLLASAMLALSPTNVGISRFITPDTFVVFFILLAFYGTIRLYQSGRPMDAVLVGLALGCLLSSKVSGILIVIPLLLALFYRWHLKTFTQPHVYIIGVCALLAFALTTPYIFGNAAAVLNDILHEGSHYATGHAGMEGDSFLWYLKFMWTTTGGLSILAALEIIRGFWSRSKQTLFVATFPLVYFAFISTFIVRNDRTFLPVTPFLFILAAAFLAFLFSFASRLHSQKMRAVILSAVMILTAAGIIIPSFRMVKNTIAITSPDGRETSRLWIDANLPAGARIGIEPYSPFIDTARFQVEPVGAMMVHDPQWYVDNGFNYLVCSQGMFARYFADPERYPSEIAAYEAIFQRFPLIRSFSDGGYEVRVYHVQ